MGLFDKIKHFAGGHGVKVRHVHIERQEPEGVSLPISDTVVKGRFEVTAEKPCTVLSMEAQLCMQLKHPDGREEEVVLGKDVYPAPHTERTGNMLQYPYELQGGGSVEDDFIIIMKRDIPTQLGERQLSAAQVRFFVRTKVDVKGSPFDPEAVNDITVQG